MVARASPQARQVSISLAASFSRRGSPVRRSELCACFAETFLGFPDPLLHELRGGSLYIQCMDAVAVAATSARLLAHKNASASLWKQLAERAEAVASSAPVTSLSFIFKALSIGAPSFNDAANTLQAVLEWRVGELELFEVAQLFEAFQNPRFANPRYGIWNLPLRRCRGRVE